MRLNVRGSAQIVFASLAGAALLFTATAVRAVCLGDCNLDGKAAAGDVTKVVRIINRCDGAASGCSAIHGTDRECVSADRNLDGLLTVDELTSVVSNVISNPSGCAPEPTPPGTPLGLRTFSLGPGSGLFSSLAPTLKGGTPAGTLMLSAGARDDMGRATVTLAGAPAIVQIRVDPISMILCTKIESCTGTLYCNGGANVDTIAQLDSLTQGLTCVRNDVSPLTCTDTAGNVCCSNACEGIGVGSGNPTLRSAGVNATDSGAGAMLLLCHERIAQVPSSAGDCSTADFANALETVEFLTTGTSTAKVLNHCAGTGAAANKPVTFFRAGQNFDCANWPMENATGVLAFSIPSEEGSDLFTGDGGNAFIYSDAPPTPTRTRTSPPSGSPTSTPTKGNTPPTATSTPTPQQLTATPTLSPTSSGATLGVRIFSINDKPKSDFFSSALSGLGVSAPAPSFTTGPLKIVGGVKGANGVAPLSLQEDVVFGLRVVDTSVVCVRLVAAGSSGSIDCDGGTAYDVAATQDSNGDQPSSPNTLVTGQGTDGGAGAASLSVRFEAALLPVGSRTSDCPTANFNIILDSAFTTKKATATVLNALDGSPSADATGKITLSKSGVNFTCETFATENSVGTLVAPFLGLDQSTGSAIIDTADVLLLADK